MALADDYATWISGGTKTLDPVKYVVTRESSEDSSTSSEQFRLEESLQNSPVISESATTLESQTSHQTPQTFFPSPTIRPTSPTTLPTPPPTPPTPPQPSPVLFQMLPYYEVRLTSKKGYSAFALQDIPRYTDILSEAALFRASAGTAQLAFNKLTEEDKELYMSLYGYKGNSPTNNIISIFKTNLFEVPSSKPGIFPYASRFNHACIPSVMYSFDTNTQRMVFTTSEDIAKGQEITISYGCNKWSLAYNYGFICDCSLCNL